MNWFLHAYILLFCDLPCFNFQSIDMDHKADTAEREHGKV